MSRARASLVACELPHVPVQFASPASLAPLGTPHQLRAGSVSEAPGLFARLNNSAWLMQLQWPTLREMKPNSLLKRKVSYEPAIATYTDQTPLAFSFDPPGTIFRRFRSLPGFLRFSCARWAWRRSTICANHRDSAYEPIFKSRSSSDL